MTINHKKRQSICLRVNCYLFMCELLIFDEENGIERLQALYEYEYEYEYELFY